MLKPTYNNPEINSMVLTYSQHYKISENDDDDPLIHFSARMFLDTDKVEMDEMTPVNKTFKELRTKVRKSNFNLD